MTYPPLNRKNAKLSASSRPIRAVQFGEGNFLRAFLDWMIYSMNQKGYFSGDVAVVQPIDRGLTQMLNEQDNLYHLYLRGVEKGETISDSYLIDVIQQCLNPYEDYDAYLDLADNPDLRFIFSNTTESGIAYEAGDKLSDRPQKSFPGKFTALLYRRFQTFKGDPSKGLIVIPCELINNNGDELKQITLRLAEDWELEQAFTDWVNNHVIFCNTLVDRIVPGYPKDTIDEIHAEIGFHDKLVSMGELFHLWVIEGPDQVAEEFPADQSGLKVLFVKDQQPYRTRKVRILNGCHTSQVPVGYLYGLDTVKESINHPVVGEFVQKALFEEIIPTLNMPEDELLSFAAEVLDRFRNPFIKHFLIDISLNSLSKYKTRVLPSVLRYQELKGVLPTRLLFSLAALIRFYKGDREGEEIALRDSKENLAFMKSLWEKQTNDGDYLALVKAVLAYDSVWGEDLNEYEGVAAQVANDLKQIDQQGIRAVLG